MAREGDMEYGAPDEGDATSVYERMGLDVAWEANRFLESEAEGVFNRQMGSVPLTPVEQYEEFEANYANPDYMEDMYWRMVGKHGGKLQAALADMLDNYVRPNLERRQRRMARW